MTLRLSQQLKNYGVLVVAAGLLAGCHSGPSTPPNTTVIEPQPTLPPPVRSSQPVLVPRMGVVTEQIAGQTRLFSTFGFWMLGDPLKTQLLACFRPDGTLDRGKLKESFPQATITEGKRLVAVALPAGNFTFFLLRDGPLISLDNKFDAMIQQLSSQAQTPP